MSSEAKAEVASGVATAAVEDFYENPLSEMAFKMTERAGKGVVQILANNKDVLAQIYARCDTPRQQKLRFDRLYIRNMSFWLDVRLILASFWISLRGEWENRERNL